MDDPSPLCPFSVHRMATVGKHLGKEIGEWFGPSTAAGAIKALTNSFPACGIAVSAATDGIIFRSEVFAASHNEDGEWEPVAQSLPWSCGPAKPSTPGPSEFGSKPVLVLVNVRLGTRDVNPIYYDSLKVGDSGIFVCKMSNLLTFLLALVQTLFSAPQTVGIAGGRPCSSYYFVGYQGNQLFYLDPHFTRPAVPYAFPPVSNTTTTPDSQQGDTLSREDQMMWLTSAYTSEQLQSFHCDRVRKMPMSGLDPSMLLGFLINDQDDWDDFCARSSTVSGLRDMPAGHLDSCVVTDTHTHTQQVRDKIFSIQDHHPSWSDEDDPGIESFSETDDGFSMPPSASRGNDPATRSTTTTTTKNPSFEPYDFDESDEESDRLPSVPPTPTRRRLRPSATETTLNARAMNDDPLTRPVTAAATTTTTTMAFRPPGDSMTTDSTGLGSSTVVLNRSEATEPDQHTSLQMDDMGVMVESESLPSV